MFRPATAVLLLLAASSTFAGFFDDVGGLASGVGDFFTKQFNNVKDLFAKDQDTLEKNINLVKDLLIAIKEKAKMLEPMANEAQKKTLGQVDNYLNEVQQFGDQVAKEGSTKFEENKGKWQQMLNDIFEKGGLDSVMKLLNLKSGGRCTLAAALVAPVVLAFIR
ncbi:hypothetical protein RB195_001399 [Necator americanus]|uniref:Uncharacterized protein n=2 Tax=Necator americanus TaxID=51031 RepID=A0ABR1DER8_NECAM|nr:hypothetical protein NECAME_04627 [Necator americanus]ETN71595.1 hypothetical protein NECAME_04627 [Necator americanus]